MVVVSRVAPDVFRCSGTHVNWYLLREGRHLTLIDAGWSGDTAAVVASVVAIGCDPRDVRAIVITHAHADHLGGVQHFRREYGTPVHMAAADAARAASGELEQPGRLDVARRLGERGAVRWALDVTRAGAFRQRPLPGAVLLPDGDSWEPLDLPGAPVPVATPGHTSGSTSYMLPGGLLATGDALITAHPLARMTGPQLPPGFFAHDPVAADASLGVLAGLDADVVLPGHGPVWRGSMGEATRIARWRADGVGASLRHGARKAGTWQRSGSSKG
ncbi:MBL fold metallo-hydrolase [Myceligenerans xiligouense]|uniref:Glyoxylase-like metal-dependent hydrolase (Beta-lactamase superfamily II) n=1 Tax=Myceligenerans xiligouense TaxID=253184 RepID=A0A3N4YI52_9MICO|nr:MBL fold metallo-hydrolase [Myceligenerans xiligouense]RPF20453.1 glyoxylase-like metal-dependent hydrolase (beta-lactamase superfamily II) [Myceligenerans xiligouense]